MRIAAIATGAIILLAATPSIAQLPPSLAIGQMEVKVFEKIPKAKVAVQLTTDTSLGRNLRGKTMERLQKRGLEVGFSGGNVMRMDIAYFDLSIDGSGGGNSRSADTPSYASPGDNQRPTILGGFSSQRNEQAAPRPPTLRMSFTLYSIDSGKVLWTAAASCATVGGMAIRAGEAMINAIFDNADKSMVGDANCPI
jgi:hypothetical protein